MVAAGPAPRATEEELQSGIPLFFDQLIERLRGSHLPTAAMGKSASLHGGNLLKRGFTVAQVVHAYGSVCQAVTELADEIERAHHRRRISHLQPVPRRRHRPSGHGVHAPARAVDCPIRAPNAWGARARASQRARRRDAGVPGSPRGKVSYSGSTSASARPEPHAPVDPDRFVADAGSYRIGPPRTGTSIRARAAGGGRSRCNPGGKRSGADLRGHDRGARGGSAGGSSPVCGGSRQSPAECVQVHAPSQSRVAEGLLDRRPGSHRRRGSSVAVFRPGRRRPCSADSSSEAATGPAWDWASQSVARSSKPKAAKLRVQDMPGHGCMFTIDLPRLPSATA